MEVLIKIEEDKPITYICLTMGDVDRDYYVDKFCRINDIKPSGFIVDNINEVDDIKVSETSPYICFKRNINLYQVYYTDTNLQTKFLFDLKYIQRDSDSPFHG
jgi:hypothetical protein